MQVEITPELRAAAHDLMREWRMSDTEVPPDLDMMSYFLGVASVNSELKEAEEVGEWWEDVC